MLRFVSHTRVSFPGLRVSSPCLRGGAVLLFSGMGEGKRCGGETRGNG